MHIFGGTADGLILSAGGAYMPTVKQTPRGTLLPLTPTQKEILASINHHGEPAYVSFKLPIPEQVAPSVDLMQYAWRAVASHNSALRARFDRSTGDWKLLISRDIATIEFDGNKPDFSDQEQPATLVVRLTQRGLLGWIRIHRALIDNHSLPLISDDFLGFLNGVAPERRADFGNFIQRTTNRDASAAKLFWRVQSESAASPPIYGVSIETAELSDSTTSQLSTEETSRILDFAGFYDENVESILYAAWATTLAHHAESAESAVTFAVTGRDAFGDEDFVGPGDHVYPLVISTEGSQSAEDMIAKITRTNSLSAVHAFIGYKAILDQFVEPEGPTLITIRRNRENTAMEHIHHYFDLFTLAVEVDISDQIDVRLHHSNTVNSKTATVIIEHFFSALRSIVADPTRMLSEIPLVSEEESKYLLDLGKPLTEPVNGLVHELLEAQAQLTPNDPAVQFERDPTLSYDQLNRLANGIARQLPTGPGKYIPVCLQRSTNLIVALCAVLKAGAGYVTTDPTVPMQRNNYIYKDVSADFAIVDRHSKGTFPKELLIEDLVEQAQSQNTSNLGVTVKPTDVVYVIYTSGSTGNPKGVLLEHRAAYSGLAAFPKIDDLRQLLFHNPVFSAAQRSVWSTLKQGGCLCLASKENLTVHIGKTINDMRINTIDVTPSTAGFITPGSVPCLKRMTVAGELINPALIPQWIDELELLNAYGLSENTQFNWRHVIQRGQNPQNIGRPIDTTTAYVLKPGTTELTPLLIPGELCLGGHQLARGYLNRPEKTKEAFIDNPFGPGRLYRTGDLVMTHADGSIEMIGRIDFSVKINDQRVDPGESNSIIQMHPKVYDSCVVAASIGGRMSLVAAIVHTDAATKDRTLEEIRQQLEKQLPRYMIPSYWTSYQELPLNINGKVDIPVMRRLCEELDRAGSLRPSQQQQPDEASNEIVEAPILKTLREVFAEALSVKLEEVPASAAFTDLGGTSLEAIKIASIAAEQGLNLTVAQVLLDSTISELADIMQPTVTKTESANNDSFLTAEELGLEMDKVEGIIPATPLQAGIMAESMMGASNYMLFRFYKLQGVAVEKAREALQAVVDARPLLRTTMILHGSTIQQVIHKELELPFRRFKGSPKKYTAEWLKSDGVVEIGDPLIRLVSLDDDVVAIETHHALVDTWSYHFIQDDVRDILGGKVLSNRPSFSNYVHYISSKSNESANEFWKTYLQDATPANLKTGEPNSSFTDISLSHELSEKKRDQLASILYTSWAVVLMSWLATEDVTFLVNISGREAPVADILDIQGPTISTVPIRVRAAGEVTIEQLMRTVSTDFWKLTDHAHIGLRNIWKAAGIESSAVNSGVNFLVSLEEQTDYHGLDPMQFEYPNVRDLVTVEMDSKVPDRVRLYCSRILQDSDGILAALKAAIETSIRNPSLTIAELRAHLADPNSSDASSPRTDPVFDVQDEPEWNLSTSRDNSVSTNPEDVPEADYEDWKPYMEEITPTMLEPAAADMTSTQLTIPMVKIRAAARKVQVSPEALLSACVGIVVGRHVEGDPIFAQSVYHDRSSVLLDQHPTHFVPQKMTLTDKSLMQVIQAVEEDQESLKLGALRISELREFASHYSTQMDVLITLWSSKSSHTRGTASKSLSELIAIDATFDGSQLGLQISGHLNQKRAKFLLDQISRVVQSTLSAPSTLMKSLDLIGSDELSIIHGLAQCNTPEPALVHAAFEKWAADAPERQALELEGNRKMTYGELNTKANKVARHLIELGVTPKSMVPLYVDKSGDMIVAILAVLKCGATYVPLSPENPAKRNLFVMTEIGAKVLVSQTQYQDFEKEHQCKAVYMDKLPDLGRFSSKNTNLGDVDTVAYCLFTSGSTGTPKGVAVSHRAISIAVVGHLNCEQTTPETRHLVFANYTFDVSVHDFFSILGSGATLCVVSTQALMSNLVGIMNEMRVSQIFLTPTVARLFTPQDVPTMKTLLCGGEALTTDIIDVWAKDCTLINMYGPTELAVDVTYNWVDHKTRSTALGHPMETCSIMIVDRGTLRLSPFGGIGELCVAGGHLADGYLNRSDLTEKAFVPCPVPGFDRMYRTGDLGRWLPDNTLQYLGRIDNQIKLNGHRIELGEIEQVVINSDLTPTCIAMILDKLTRPQLAIFCIFEHSSEPGIKKPASKDMLEKLRTYFSSLAHYMVPSFIFPVGNIPRMSASNKSDRKALKAMAEQLSFEQLTSYGLDVAEAEATDGDAEPLTAEESMLRDLWSEMFVRPKNSIVASTNFANLGGDSISAINLVSSCRKSGYAISVNDILKGKTLKNIAKQLTHNDPTKKQAAKKYEPPAAIYDMMDQHGLDESDVEYIYPCAPGQSEFLSHGASKEQNWSATAVRPLPHDANEYFELLQKLTSMNDILRTTFTRVEGHGWVGVVLRDTVVDFTTLSCKPEDKERIVESVKKRRFTFGRPFVRYVLLKYPDGSQDLAMKMDHGLWDGTSLRIFDDAVLTLQREGKAPQLTPFKDYAFDQWQSDKKESLAFWRNVVKDGEGSGIHAAKPKIDSRYVFTTDESIDANKLAQDCGVTAATLFQGIFQLWLAEHSQRKHASYDYLLTGRNVDLPEPQTINGVCANFLPFRLPIDGDQRLPDFLADTQDFFWQATKYGNVGLDDIYSDAGLDRQAVGNRVLFLYQPFEPSDTTKKEMRWVVLAMSKSWMTQPYALMEEVHKVDDNYKIVVKWDSSVYQQTAIEGFVKRQLEILKECIDKGSQSVQLKQVVH